MDRGLMVFAMSMICSIVRSPLCFTAEGREGILHTGTPRINFWVTHHV